MNLSVSQDSIRFRFLGSQFNSKMNSLLKTISDLKSVPDSGCRGSVSGPTSVCFAKQIGKLWHESKVFMQF